MGRGRLGVESPDGSDRLNEGRLEGLLSDLREECVGVLEGGFYIVGDVKYAECEEGVLLSGLVCGVEVGIEVLEELVEEGFVVDGV